MTRKKKTAARLIIVYLVLTVGCKMFIDSCTNSHNRLSSEKITPAYFSSNKGNMTFEVLGSRLELNYPHISTESHSYLTAYLLLPDEIRSGILLYSDLRARTVGISV